MRRPSLCEAEERWNKAKGNQQQVIPDVSLLFVLHFKNQSSWNLLASFNYVRFHFSLYARSFCRTSTAIIVH